MSQNSDGLKKIVKEHSEKLAKLGIELAKNQFSYKVESKPSKEYWQKRIDDFKKYNEKGMEYYNEIHSLMNIINREESQMFLLRIGKFRQIGLVFIEIMEKIKENPTIMDKKDKQQSQWSKKIKNQITEQSNTSLNFEMDMNSSFREFYDKQVKEILE
ncbi:MAG: hypothetical protein HOM82_03905 [Thaumarchaeota archaeon]|jgi:hypothetical protein|nr:hypothetical protein [Nitrososphaerota archaeon]